MTGWTFLTNHARVLLCVARDPTARLRDLAAKVGITERAVQRILADLVKAGYVSVVREGRRNCYQVHLDPPFRHPRERGHRVGELLTVTADAEPGLQRA
ncbi:helix-turn-helix transcriptional regulator [Nonomuraea sp. NPDC050328]|uniref:helix-turn-helix transcriptional regulator n=1 Tax=Nonomuraea sp. NPDC050328 TaxID=3364361 RepID=UPI003799C7D6